MQTPDLLTPPPARLINHPGEAELVYESLRLAVSGRAGEVDWARFGELEWRLLARMARPGAEGVGPLIYWNFRDGSWPAAMPEAVRRRLARDYYNTLANNTVILGELKQILAAFGRVGIPVIVLKGAVLAVTAYEDPGLRPMGDLDLLVRPEHLKPAMRALHECGYDLHKISVHAQYLREQRPPVMVELHWGVVIRDVAGHLPDMDWFWEHARPAEAPELAGALVLPPAAHAVYLGAHATLQHAGFQGRLIWGRDLELLGAGCVLPVTAFTWPAGSGESRPDPGSSRLRAAGHHDEEDESPRRIFDALSLLGWRMRLACMWRILVPPAGYMRRRYRVRASYQLPYYYMVRWVEGLRYLE